MTAIAVSVAAVLVALAIRDTVLRWQQGTTASSGKEQERVRLQAEAEAARAFAELYTKTADHEARLSKLEPRVESMQLRGRS